MRKGSRKNWEFEVIPSIEAFQILLAHINTLFLTDTCKVVSFYNSRVPWPKSYNAGDVLILSLVCLGYIDYTYSTKHQLRMYTISRENYKKIAELFGNTKDKYKDVSVNNLVSDIEKIEYSFFSKKEGESND